MTEPIPKGQRLAQFIADAQADHRSLYNLLPASIHRAFENLDEDLLDKSEKELERILDPDPFVCRMRLALWRAFEEAQSKLKKINLNDVSLYLGVPSNSVIAHLKMPHHLIFFLCPPTSYDIYLDEALSYGLRRLRNDILTMNIEGPDGQVDPRKADLLLKAIAFVDMRKNGGIVQRTENLNINTQSFKKISKDLELKEIDEKIKELELKGTLGIARQVMPVITNESLDD